MKRKRFIKLLMASGVPRNEAVVYADACGPELPHNVMGFVVETVPQVRETVRPFLMQILQGAKFSMEFELSNSCADTTDPLDS